MGRKATMQSLRLLLVQASQRGYSPFSNTYCSPLQLGFSYPTHLEKKVDKSLSYFLAHSFSLHNSFPVQPDQEYWYNSSAELVHFTVCISPLICQLDFQKRVCECYGVVSLCLKQGCQICVTIELAIKIYTPVPKILFTVTIMHYNFNIQIIV